MKGLFIGDVKMWFTKALDVLRYEQIDFRRYVNTNSSPPAHQSCHFCHEEDLRKVGWKRMTRLQSFVYDLRERNLRSQYIQSLQP